MCVSSSWIQKTKNFWKRTFLSTAIQLYSVPLFFSNNEIDKSVGNLFCASRVAESKNQKIFENGRSYRPLFNCIACHYFFFKQRDRQKCWEPFLCVSSNCIQKTKNFWKPTFLSTAIQLYSVPLLFFSNNEIDKSVVNLFCASRVAVSKKPKIFENGRSYRPLFNCIACHFFFSNNEIDKSVGNLFCASRVAESKKPKIFENGRSYRPLFNCIACHYFFFKQRDRQKCCEPFLCVSSSWTQKTKNFWKPTFLSTAIQLYSVPQLFFFKQRDRQKCWEPFLCVSSSWTQKTKNFWKPTFLSTAIQLYSVLLLFFSNNEIDKSVGNLFCASRVAVSKKPKIFENGRSYWPLFNCIACHFFFSNNEIDKSGGNLFCASWVAESKKPKIYENGRSYRPLFNCIACHYFFFQTTR